ncbi:MAG: hypothetical protein NZ694_11160 [Tepidimonas sp.]|nr:hypothetical protein [Tepidimonas sp.]
MLEGRALMHDQVAGLAAWGLRPPLRVVALVEAAGAATALALRLADGCLALGLEVAAVDGAPPLWDDVAQADVWLWRADPEVLLRWWPQEAAHPVVPLLAQPRVIVAAYRALKRLRLAGLAPVVVALAQQPGDAQALPAALTALRRTCAQHLAWQPPAWTLGYHGQCEGPGDAGDDAAVVTRVLEAAWTLDAAAPAERRSAARC